MLAKILKLNFMSVFYCLGHKKQATQKKCFELFEKKRLTKNYIATVSTQVSVPT